MLKPTPLAVFAYNRPMHLQKTLYALSHCQRIDECEVFIYCDGSNKPEHLDKVEQTRKVAQDWAANNHASVIERDENWGISKSITSTVSQLCSKYGRVIVVEDDLIVSRVFIDFMLQALDWYKDDVSVYQVSGFIFGKKPIVSGETCLLPVTSTWGWATWERAWNYYDRNPQAALSELKNPEFKHKFDLNGTYPFAKMLEENVERKNDSWGIWWWWTVCRNQGLVVYPRKSLVFNNGLDNSGIHSGKIAINQLDISDLEVFPGIAQIMFQTSAEVDHKVLNRYLSRINSNHSISTRTSILKILSLFHLITPTKILLKFIRNGWKKISVILNKDHILHNKWEAKIGSNSQIFPEGSIENIYGDPSRVIIGENTYIRGRLIIYGHDGQINIGDWCFIGARSEIWSMTSVQIGDRVLISHDVNIHDGTGHSMNHIERHDHFKNIILHGHPRTWDELPGIKSVPIIIEDDVWIGFGVTILQGVHIGARSVIAAGSLVTKDVPSDSFYRCSFTPIITNID